MAQLKQQLSKEREEKQAPMLALEGVQNVADHALVAARLTADGSRTAIDLKALEGLRDAMEKLEQKMDGRVSTIEEQVRGWQRKMLKNLSLPERIMYFQQQENQGGGGARDLPALPAPHQGDQKSTLLRQVR